MENAIPATYLTQPFKNKTDRENFERNNGNMMRQVYLGYDENKFLIISVSLWGNYYQILYDKKTFATYNMQKIKPDSLSFQLPILNEYGYARKDNRYYKLLTPETLKAAYEQKGKSAPYPPELQACFTDPKNPTPVIVEYTIKDN